MVSCLWAFGESEVAALRHHHLARERETDARARALRSEERYEHLARHLSLYRRAVVADEQLRALVGASCADIYVVSASLRRILHDVGQHLVHHACVGAQRLHAVDVHVPGESGIERLQVGDESLQVNLLEAHRLQLRHLAVALHERRQAATRVVYRLDALLERRSLHHLAAYIRLRDALYRRHGVHYLVRQHARQPLPRLHLAACHQLVNLSAHLVEHLLQVALAGHDAVRWQSEHEVAVAQRLAHKAHSGGEAPLVEPLKDE